MADQRLTQLFEVTPDVFAKIAYRGESGGLLLVIPYLDTPLDSLMTTRRADHPPFFAIIEGVEKPGNLGAILRTADAAGVDGLIVCPGETRGHRPPQPQRDPGQPGHPLHRQSRPGRERHGLGLAANSTASPPWPPPQRAKSPSPRPTWPVPWPW